MQIGEAKIGALILAAVTCLGVTLVVGGMLGSYEMGFRLVFPYALPIALFMGAVLFFMVSDDIKPGKKPPEDE